MANDNDRPRISGQREGFALAGALLAMVVVGALVTGSFFAASQEHAIGLSARYADQAMYVAEYGAQQAMATVPKSLLDTLHGTMRIDTLAPKGANGQKLGTDTVWVRSLGNVRIFVSKGVASSRDPRVVGGHRVVAIVSRTMNVSFPMDRAMQLYAGIKVSGSSVVSGKDTFPDTTRTQFTGWKGQGCDTVGLQNAIVSKDIGGVSTQGSGKIVGPVKFDTTLNANSFFKFGDANYNALASLANIVGPGGWNPKPKPSATGGVCNTADQQNWGEPGSLDGSATIVPACSNYFPIIHVTGDLKLNSQGRGQGILMVDGTLDVSGGFEFWGITIIKGQLKTTGSGGHLYGTTMSYDLGDLSNDNTSIGNSVAGLSTCAIKRAAANAPGFNRAIPLRMHSWMDLTAAGAGF